VTIAFGFMVEVTSNRWSFTGGPMGIMSIPKPTLPDGSEMTSSIFGSSPASRWCASCLPRICFAPVWDARCWHDDLIAPQVDVDRLLCHVPSVTP
jgi:hypothetical protein